MFDPTQAHPLHFPPSLYNPFILHSTHSWFTVLLILLFLSATMSVFRCLFKPLHWNWLTDFRNDKYIYFPSCTRMHMQTPNLLFDMWVDTEWLGNEAHSLWVSDLTGKGGCQENKRGRESRNNSNDRKRLSLVFHHSSAFICHLLWAPCQQLECCVDTGESRGKEQRQKMFKCWWQPLVAAGTGVSALILPQDASDRQMIEKELGRRREEKRQGGVGCFLCLWCCLFWRQNISFNKEKGGAVGWMRLVFYWPHL